ncbi:MAG: hypothetical protein E3K37_11925 [Candidatus Kuenenia sp.]|nr:hypothetical protein [Candidatus Kuenenia hertensis]
MPIDEHAIGIHIILRNKAGTFPKILENLSGLIFEEDTEFKQKNNNLFYPSFHYSRYQNCSYGKKQREQYFYFTADITLENSVANNAEKGAVILSLPTPDESLVERNSIIDRINSLLFSSQNNGWLGHIKKSDGKIVMINIDDNLEQHIRVAHELLEKNCLFQVTVSPETYRAKIFNILQNSEFYRHFIPEELLNAEFNRSYVNTQFSYNENIHIERIPLAKLHICCRHGDKSGALAAAINTLLFRKFNGYRNDGLQYVFNIMFLIDYFSFSPSVAYDAIYGRLTDFKKDRIKIAQKDDDNNNHTDISKPPDVTRAREVIERILICPISDNNSCNNSWVEYANKLHEYLKENGEISYKEPIKDQYNNNILIYRNEHQPCWIQDEDHNKRNAPNTGCDICRKCWRIDELRKVYH